MWVSNRIQALAQARATFVTALDIIACDGKYGNVGFLRPVKGLRCGITARLRVDRVLYRPAPVHDSHQKGRTRVHGARFAFKEADTWGEPDEVIELEVPRWGQVRLQRWKDLHEKKGVDVPYTMIRASVHLERETPPAALWLAWLAPKTTAAGMVITAETPAALDPTTRAAKYSPDFCADRHACSPSQTAWNSAWLAFRQAQNAEISLSSGQEDTACDKNDLKLGW